MAIPASISALPQRSAELRDLLVRWCNQNSGSDNFAGLAAMLELLHAEFSTLAGATVERVALTGTPAQALRVRMRPGAPTQLFLSGHYDTVYGANDPFQLCEQLTPETLRGPGVIDMKGGLVTMLAALQAFEQSPGAANVGYEVLINPDEEIGSAGATPLFEDAAKRFQFGLIFEPARTNGDLVRSRKGIGNFTVTSRGRAAHAASAKQEGRNAITALAEYLIAAARIPSEMPGVLLNIGNIRGGSTATNVVPDFAESQLDVRVNSATESESVIARLNALAEPFNAREGHRVEITGEFNRPPMECTPLTEKVFATWQECGRELGFPEFSWIHAGGGSDGNLLAAAGLPCLDGLGPLGDRLHSAEEWISLPSIATRAQLAALALHRIAISATRLL